MSRRARAASPAASITAATIRARSVLPVCSWVSVPSTSAWDLQSLPWLLAARLCRRFGCRALRRLGADVRGERELHQLGEELLDPLHLSHHDALVDDPEDPADDRLLECPRQILALRRDLASHAEERHEGLDRAFVALDRGRAGGEGLDDAGAGQRRLAGDVVEEGAEAGVYPGGPSVDPAGGVDDALQGLLDRELRGGEEAVFLGGEVLVEGVAGDAGATHDVGHGDRAVALLDRLLRQRRDDAGALVSGDELAWQRMPPGGQSGHLGDMFSHKSEATRGRSIFKLDGLAIYRYSTGGETICSLDHEEGVAMGSRPKPKSEQGLRGGYDLTSVRTVLGRTGLYRQAFYDNFAERRGPRGGREGAGSTGRSDEKGGRFHRSGTAGCGRVRVAAADRPGGDRRRDPRDRSFSAVDSRVTLPYIG